jgi:SPP1 gp7 family putative phage head morphogenesis protein
LATNRAKRREQRLQSALLDRLTFKYQRLITKEIAKTMVSVNLSDPMGVDQAEAALEERLTKLFTRMWNESGEDMVNYLFGEQQKAVFTQFAPTIGTNAIMRDYIRIFGVKKVTQVARTTINQLKQLITRGVEEGLSERDIGRSIREKAPIISASRAQTIARTETHAAANYAAEEAFLSTGIEARREWVTAVDERTRESHVEADGQIVALHEPFIVDGEELMYPGDPSGSAENVINCRCARVYVFD